MSDGIAAGRQRSEATPIRGKAKWIPLADLSQPQTKAAHAYWLTKLGGRAMPAPKDVDPTEIRRLLSYITLIEVLDATPADYYFRIEGEAVQQAIGFKRMGRKLSQLTAELGRAYSRAFDRLKTATESRAPLAQTSLLSDLGRGFYTVESVLLPLSREGQRVDQILVSMGFIRRPEDMCARLNETLKA